MNSTASVQPCGSTNSALPSMKTCPKANRAATSRVPAPELPNQSSVIARTSQNAGMMRRTRRMT